MESFQGIFIAEEGFHYTLYPPMVCCGKSVPRWELNKPPQHPITMEKIQFTADQIAVINKGLDAAAELARAQAQANSSDAYPATGYLALLEGGVFGTEYKAQSERVSFRTAVLIHKPSGEWVPKYVSPALQQKLSAAAKAALAAGAAFSVAPEGVTFGNVKPLTVKGLLPFSSADGKSLSFEAGAVKEAAPAAAPAAPAPF